MADDIRTIDDLRHDPENARRRTTRSSRMLATSLQDLGAARSIVIDEDGIILAGNGTVEAAGEIGLRRVKVIDADGDELIAVRRTNLTPDQKAQLALFDNRTAELAGWDAATIAADINAGVDLSALWNEEEIDSLMAASTFADDDAWAQSLTIIPDEDRQPFQRMAFILHEEQLALVEEALQAAKGQADFSESPNENSDGNALAYICEVYLHG